MAVNMIAEKDGNDKDDGDEEDSGNLRIEVKVQYNCLWLLLIE